jgi:hypothetical protein
MNKCIKISVRTPEGTWPFGRPKSGRGDNIRMDCTDTRCEDVYWTQMIWVKEYW